MDPLSALQRPGATEAQARRELSAQMLASVLKPMLAPESGGGPFGTGSKAEIYADWFGQALAHEMASGGLDPLAQGGSHASAH